MPGYDVYPKITIIRDGDRNYSKREYAMNEKRMKWIDDLFASHRGKTYVDFRNSIVEIMR